MAPSWMLVPRSFTGDIQGGVQTFSSWHNCMQKAYCKYDEHDFNWIIRAQLTSSRWPVIIGIVIASLIVLSIVWCCVRCLCCGLSCCCECFSCLTCCDSCRGRRKSPRSNYADGPPAFAPYQGYQPAPNPPAYEPPRFATFDAPSKNGNIHEDSLPAMPSWDSATSRRVEDHTAHEDMEMGVIGPGAGAQAAHENGGRYNQIPDQLASPYGTGPAEYRGANVTQPYGSDLGAQRLATEDAGYGSGAFAGTSYAHGPSYSDRSPHDETSSYGGAAPYRSSAQPGYFQQQPQQHESRFHGSSPAPTYQTYAPTQPYSPTDSTRYAPTTAMGSMHVSPTDVRPPSLLQVGRKPIPGSGREV